MQPNLENNNQQEVDPRTVPPSTMYLETWWHGNGYRDISPSTEEDNASNSSSVESPNCSESDVDQSLSNNEGPNEEDDDANKKPQATASSQSVKVHRQEHSNLGHVAPMVPTMHGSLNQPPQPELAGHSIAYASNPYLDPYYAGMMAAYGHQPLAYTPYARMPLPLEVAQVPVYVNAKQYPGILRRRQARAKAELERKLIKVRKPYLHESRHQHAIRRARGTGGRFAKKTNADASRCTSKEKGNGSDPGHSSQSGCSSGSETLHADSAETLNSSVNHHQAQGSRGLEAHHLNGECDTGCINLGGLHTSTHQTELDKRMEAGDRSLNRQGSVSSKHTPLRGLGTSGGGLVA